MYSSLGGETRLSSAVRRNAGENAKSVYGDDIDFVVKLSGDRPNISYHQ
jgi:hypothetical protein